LTKWKNFTDPKRKNPVGKVEKNFRPIKGRSMGLEEYILVWTCIETKRSFRFMQSKGIWRKITYHRRQWRIGLKKKVKAYGEALSSSLGSRVFPLLK
jgi:hypothetical protein